jgi:uncharacterized protein YhaN
MKTASIDQEIEQLTEELREIRIRERETQELIEELKEERRRSIQEDEPKNKKKNIELAQDREGTTIEEGDEVLFLTEGKYISTGGTVTKISRRSKRVTSRDSRGNLIVRAQRNVKVIKKNGGQARR